MKDAQIPDDDEQVSFLPQSRVRVLLAIVTLAERDGRCMFGEIRDRAGYSNQVVSACLHELRDFDLIAFEDGLVGTIRPSVHRVPFG